MFILFVRITFLNFETLLPPDHHSVRSQRGPRGRDLVPGASPEPILCARHYAAHHREDEKWVGLVPRAKDFIITYGEIGNRQIKFSTVRKRKATSGSQELTWYLDLGPSILLLGINTPADRQHQSRPSETVVDQDKNKTNSRAYLEASKT